MLAMSCDLEDTSSPRGISPPDTILLLLLDELLKIHLFAELIRLCTRVADPTFRVQVLCNLHDPLTVHSQKPTTHLLQLNRREWQRSPLARGLLLHLDHLRDLGCQTPFEKYRDCHPVKEMASGPGEVDVNAVLAMRDLDAPKVLRNKVLHSKVSIHNETQCGKLAGTVAEYGTVDMLDHVPEAQRLHARKGSSDA